MPQRSQTLQRLCRRIITALLSCRPGPHLLWSCGALMNKDWLRPKKIRGCDRCWRAFRDTFRIPELWWTTYCKNSNGYIGCEHLRDKIGNATHFSMWCETAASFG